MGKALAKRRGKGKRLGRRRRSVGSLARAALSPFGRRGGMSASAARAKAAADAAAIQERIRQEQAMGMKRGK